LGLATPPLDGPISVASNRRVAADATATWLAVATTDDSASPASQTRAHRDRQAHADNNTSGGDWHQGDLSRRGLIRKAVGIAAATAGIGVILERTATPAGAATSPYAPLSTVGVVESQVGPNINENTGFGSDNSAYAGSGTLWNLTTGTANTAVGTAALFGTTSGIQNTAIGAGALRDVANGGGNTGLGIDVGVGKGPGQSTSWATVTGGANTWLGGFAGPSNASDPSFCVAVGGVAMCGANGATALGAQSVANGAYGTAVGAGATAAGLAAIGVGTACVSSSIGTVAIGYGSKASAVYATALGILSSATAPGSVAIGTDHSETGASTDVQDEIRLGTPLHTVKIPGALDVLGNIIGGGYSSANGVTISTALPTAGVAFTPNATKDTEISFTGNSQALTLTSGPSTGAEYSLFSAANAGTAMFTKRVPAGWRVIIATATSMPTVTIQTV
jgi:hypothetical protein